MIKFFCPACFAEMPVHDTMCATCHIDIDQWRAERTFTERLIHGLNHRNPEARMSSIITLGNRREEVAAIPLAQCAWDHPIDVIQGMQIVNSLSKIYPSPERDEALRMLKTHPARVVRRGVADIIEGRYKARGLVSSNHRKAPVALTSRRV